jgi:RNA recognition motif-containing protein
MLFAKHSIGGPMSAAKLYVGNLSYDTSESTLEALFAAHGEVASITLVMDRDTGRPKGFGFVEMATPEQATAAKEALDGQQIDGRTIKVDNAKEQQPRRSGGGGYGGGGRGGSGGGSGGYGGGGGGRW